MGYFPVTSFRRAIDAAQLAQAQVAPPPLPAHSVNKWELLRELTVAQKAYDLSHRDLDVLQALLSFYPSNDLDRPEMVVFPSNRTLCERLKGMPCSTMRRHLGNLVASGLIRRKDSPNGKRYRRRSQMGEQAFGFDLSPLPRHYSEILTLAEEFRREAEAIAQLRETVSLMRRDLRTLLIDCEDEPVRSTGNALLEETARLLRRNLTLDLLVDARQKLSFALAALCPPPVEPPHSAEEMSTNVDENEQHQQKQKKETYESVKSEDKIETKPALPISISLRQVVLSCPELLSYANDPIGNWHGFVQLAERVRPMMGICASAWSAAKDAMGSETAAITLAVILQRFAEIRSPGAYLRSLSSTAARGGLRIEAMLAALARRSQPSSQL